MKTRVTALLVACLLTGCATTEFSPYEGAQQNWPTASGALVSTKYAVPVYRGFPPRPYIVLGELSISKTQKWGWSDAESEAIEAAAQEAKAHGADAVIIQGSKSENAGAVSTGTAFVTGPHSANFVGSSITVLRGKASVLIIKFK